MCCKNLLFKMAVLGMTFGLGLVAAAYVLEISPSTQVKLSPAASHDLGTGLSHDRGIGSAADPMPGSVTSSDKLTGLEITSKPRATYTDLARNNEIQGVVRLKVTFLASGEIGGIQVVSELPDGLTEQAVAAAKQIKFEPRKVNGAPVSVTRVLEYSFTIY